MKLAAAAAGQDLGVRPHEEPQAPAASGNAAGGADAQAPEPDGRVGLRADDEDLAARGLHLRRRDAQAAAGGGAAPAAGGVVGRRKSQVAATARDNRDPAVEGVDQLRRVGPDEGRGAQRALGDGGRGVEAEAPGIRDGAAAVTEAGGARLGAELYLNLTAGALDAAAHGTRSVADLRLHRGAEVAANGGGD